MVDTADSGISLVSQPIVPAEGGIPVTMTSLESMLPLLKLLPALVLEQTTYHLRGAISKSDLQEFSTHARLVREFTLSRTSKSPSDEVKLSSGTFVRLGQLQNRDSQGPLLPSLETLRLINPDELSMFQLSLFFTPSLRSLEATNIPKNQEIEFLSFLITLVDEAPHLTAITLGPGPFTAGCLEACLNFKLLHCLELKEVITTIGVDLLTAIGNLPELQTFVLDDRIGKYNGEDKVHTGFLCLRKLHVTGTMELIRFLHNAVGSAVLQDLGLTLVRRPPISIYSSNGKRKKKSSADPVELVVDSTTEAFCNVVNGGWHQTLKSIRLNHLQDYVGESTDLFWVPQNVSPKLLRLPVTVLDLLLERINLEDLEIAGWTLPESASGHKLDTFQRFPNLKTIHLPFGSEVSKIHLSELQSIAEFCPHLISLQCNFENLSSFTPPQLSFEMPSHGLKVLSIGSSSQIVESIDWKHNVGIAAFLDALFPNLERIETQEVEHYSGHYSEQWRCIHDLVKMCQTSRRIHANRLSASSSGETSNDGASR